MRSEQDCRGKAADRGSRFYSSIGVPRAAAAVPVMAAVLVLLAGTVVRGGTEPNAVLRVESRTGGEIGFAARGVTVDQALAAIASEAGFDVVVDREIRQLPVNMAVSAMPVEDLLRQILRGRNYALVYDGDDASLSRVIVLAPPAPRAQTYRQVRSALAAARRR